MTTVSKLINVKGNTKAAGGCYTMQSYITTVKLGNGSSLSISKRFHDEMKQEELYEHEALQLHQLSAKRKKEYITIYSKIEPEYTEYLQ